MRQEKLRLVRQKKLELKRQLRLIYKVGFFYHQELELSLFLFCLFFIFVAVAVSILKIILKTVHQKWRKQGNLN